jgi:hypothetical protein
LIRIDLHAEPQWLDLATGVRIRVAPLTTAIMAAARADPDVEALGEDPAQDALAIALAKAIAVNVILDWEGVGDADGNPVEPNPQTIGALLDLWPMFEAFQLEYVAKGLLLEQEKNVSAPSPNGTSAGATDTAPPAPDAAPGAPAS